MKSNGFKSRFSAAPSSATGNPAVKTVKAADAYFASARQKSQKLRNYFDDDEDEDQSLGAGFATNTPVDGDDYDPLDAFMAGVQEQVQKEEKSIGSYEPLPEIVSGQDDGDYDQYLENLDKPALTAEGDEVQYDSDGFPIVDSGKKDGEKSRIEPLPIVDHSTIRYKSFRKNFYSEKAEVSSMSEIEVSILREELEVSVSGSDIPRPIKSFENSCLPALLVKEISKVGFEKPTSIQAQAISIALSGRDMIGLAKTGSGKTLAYVWPMIVHVLDQPQMQIGDGPIGIVLSPTRELAAQIFTEAKKFAKAFSIRVCAVFGGGGKWEMVKALKEAPEIVVATPGRFIELIRNKSTNLSNCSLVVLDEADRMFEMGFEYQMRSIVNNVRPDRQTLLFSATMKRKVEGFARELLTNPIRIVVGTIGQANPDIRQVVELVKNEDAKWTWLAERADEYVADGKVLIFVLSKSGVETLTAALRRHFTARQLDVGVESLHGDKDQAERTMSMKKFSSSKETAILVATDIASRGLDVKDIRTVINYDIAKNIETYVHRIGRTGRMGLDGVVPGTAYTLIGPSDGSFAVDLVQNLNLSSQKVPPELLALAEKDPKWSRIKHISAGGGRNGPSKITGFQPAVGRGGGLGYESGGRPAIKAMTSSMLAASSGVKSSGSGSGSSSSSGSGVQMTFSKAMGVASKSVGGSTVPASGGVIPGNTAANPYIEGQGMGRGKHLTTPSWSDGTDVPPPLSSASASSSSSLSSVSASSSSSLRAVVPQQFNDATDNTTVALPAALNNFLHERKRNRFSAIGSAPAPPAPTMAGFIRAAVTGNSFLAGNNTVSTTLTVEKTDIAEKLGADVVVQKKSRWDK